MPRIEITGLNAFGLGVTAAYVDTNRDVVRRVLNFLEDRNVLWRPPISENPEPSRLSAEMIRRLLTQEILNVKHGGKIEASFKKIRTAARNFDGAAGLHSATYLADSQYFLQMLMAMRLTVGQECAYLAAMCHLDLEQHVLDALPQQDLSFIPGFAAIEP